MSYACSMLRRNMVAVTSDTKENATWPTSRAFTNVILLRLLPAVRASSFSVSDTLVRDTRRAGMMPNTRPVNNERIRAKTKTGGSILGAMKFVDTSDGRNDHKSCDPSYPINSPTRPPMVPRKILSVRS